MTPPVDSTQTLTQRMQALVQAADQGRLRITADVPPLVTRHLAGLVAALERGLIVSS